MIVTAPASGEMPVSRERADDAANTRGRGLPDHLGELFRHRELLLLWVAREVKIRYQQSLLGSAWAILQPLALMLTFTTIFAWIIRVPSDDIPYPLFSYTALLVWTLFATALNFAIPSLVNNMNLVTKIYFPREILPIASVCAALVDFVVASSLLVILLLWYRIPITLTVVWVPLLLVVQLVLILGVCIPACALNVFYRDFRFIVPLALQLWMYATPIVYPLSLVPERFRTVYALNPMVGIVDSYRRVLLEGRPPAFEYLGPSVVVSAVLIVAGYTYFKRTEGCFADLI